MKRFALLFCLFVVSVPARATIYLDFEPEPLPLVDVSVLLPVGFESKDPADVGAPNVLSDILESGTTKLDRQAFLEKVSEFGANYDFSVSNRNSEWSLSFPLVEGKGVEPLIEVLSQNWASPRFEKKTFDLAKLKLASSLKASIDSDNSLAISGIRRTFNKKEVQGLPVLVENVARLKLAMAKKVFERDFQSVPDVWAGVVAPQSSLELVKKILKTVFAKQGDVVVGQHLEKFKLYQPDLSKIKAAKHVLIIDKPGRAQTVTAATSFYPGDLKPDQELAFFFGNHVFFDSGLGSIWAEEIRTKRGLAYFVQSTGQSYLGMPSIGFIMNPQRNKAEQAFQVAAGLLKSGFEKSDLLKALSKDAWERNWKSFKFNRILSASTPSGRLGEREAVVLGNVSPEFYKSDPNNWKTSPEEVGKVFNQFWNGSAVYLAVVGEAKELKPLIEKSFPDYAVKVVPYKDIVSEKGYR